MPKNERDFKDYSAVSRKHKWEKTLLKKFSPGTWFPGTLTPGEEIGDPH